MDTSKLKTFAQGARKTLLEQVEAKIRQVLAENSGARRESAAAVARLEGHIADAGRNAVIDSVAYTWFNRFCALRFMDVKGYTRVRIVSPSEGFTQPEILAEAKSGQFDDQLTSESTQKRVSELLNGTVPSQNPQGEAYRILLVAACNSYRKILPSVFEHIADEIELLMPDDLLAAGSVLSGVVETLTEDDCKDVEVLGWLYQFYISERKDQVMARKSAVPTEDIPAVTQLFTPHWIVRYLVENSLGRLWMLNHPQSRLIDHMPYYIAPCTLDIPVRDLPSTKQQQNTTDRNVHPTSLRTLDIPVRDSSLFSAENETNTTDRDVHPTFLKITKPEDIRLLDPAVGSGHMLTYAFDLLTLIYEEEGYAPTEIPALILRHNLHGLEICPRAAQLAELALVFKAREKSRRFFQSEHFVRPNIIELRDVHFADGELDEYFKVIDYPRRMDIPVRRPASPRPSHPSPLGGEGTHDGQECPSYGELTQQLHQFEEAKNFGSLIQPCLTEAEIQTVRSQIENQKSKIENGDLFVASTHLKVLRVLEQAEALTQRYHVVVANPPYMGSIQLNGPLERFVSANFSEGSQDLYGAFIMRNLCGAMPGGLVAMITFQNWLSASSFKELREYLIDQCSILSLVHNGRGVWGADFGSCAFVFGKKTDQVGSFFRLFSKISLVATNEELEARFLATIASPTATIGMREFAKIPSSAIVYWASAHVRSIFRESKTLGSVVQFKAGMSTGNNPMFQRNWFEVGRRRFAHPGTGTQEGRDRRWFPCNSGGDFRKWYGNDEIVVDWENGGTAIKSYQGSAVRNEGYYSKTGLTYNKISIGRFAARYRGTGYVFDDTGRCVFPISEETDIYTILGFLCSAVADHFLRMLTPTVSFTSKELDAVPWRDSGVKNAAVFSQECISLARADWDNFETSWDFRDQPLLRPGLKGATLEASWRNWEAQCTAAIRRMQELETENNRLFIAAYGLEGELQPEVPEEQITLARADARRDMAAFLSYSVGCMMGRYSLDVPGLVLADAGGTVDDYARILSSRSLDIPVRASSFSSSSTNEANKEEEEGNTTDRDVHPTEDNVIPILDADWFQDDITARFKQFLKITFGDEHFDANIRFIEESLGKDLRKYFLTDFYKNHVQTYKKRPIYWMFSSPKGTFNALIYMHRYRPDTVSVVLKYLRDYQSKLRAHVQHLQSIADSADAKKADKARALKDITQMKKDLKELEDYERKVIYPLASQRLEIDLDNGVKHNYPLFGEALKKIPGLDAKEE